MLDDNKFEVPQDDFIPAILIFNRNREVDDIFDYLFPLGYMYKRGTDSEGKF